MLASYDVLIVGGGHAGAQLAANLRRRKFAGTIGIITEEDSFPYERPPLSKDYLSGERAFEKILIRPESFWQTNDIDVLRGRRVVAVDPDARTVTTESGESVGWEKLVWAAGGTPKVLTVPGHDLPGIHIVRSRADSDRIRGAIAGAQDAVIIGAGYIGLEVAAILRKLGKQVVLLEAMPRVLSRVAGEELSRFYEAVHRERGADLRLESRIAAFTGDDHVTGVRLADGEVVPADVVVLGVGIEPAVGPLIAAGAAGSNGVRVDALCRTSLADVFAIGDCAEHVSRYAGNIPVRIESVQNANDMAGTVAAYVADGEEKPYEAVPWFWSTQYDLRLQTVGLLTDYDETVLRGDPDSGSFSVVYLRAGRVVALDCVNAPKDYVQGKALVAAELAVDRERLADAETPLKDLL